MPSSSSISRSVAWPIALLGLGLLTFGAVGLWGSGRIDVVDGQTCFEVGRSLVEHGDFDVRDQRLWWGRYPGRDARFYADDRLPQSLAAAAAIRVADATGPESEGRRHFFFILSGAVACGLLSVVYAVWFRHLGCRPLAAIFWAAGGIFCTPAWFYGTSAFDEYLGTLLVVAAVVCAAMSRHRASMLGAIGSGLLLGLAYCCAQPLAAFGLLAVAWHDDSRAPVFQRMMRFLLIAGGLSLGVAAELGYHRFKFPFDNAVVHADLYSRLSGPIFANHQLQAIAALLFSFAVGAIWYFPPLFITLTGIWSRWKDDRRTVLALLISAIAFLGVIASLACFKGDPAWGPRYLTPLFGILWLFAPAGAARLPKIVAGVLLVLGAIVQLLALSVDIHRLYIRDDVSPEFGRADPSRYFDPSLSHLLNRPREIIDIARNSEPAQEYSPSPSPTFAFPIIEQPYLEKRGPDVVGRYQVLNWYRPWWANMSFLPTDERPVNLGKFAAILLAFVSVGLILLGLAAGRLETG
jgi:hypothetical protein